MLVIGGQCRDVLLTQVAGQVCHQIALAKTLAIHLELKGRVLPILTRQIRNGSIPLAIWTVTSFAAKHIRSRVAFFGKLLTAGNLFSWLGARCERGRASCGIILCDRFDLLVIESLGDGLHERVFAISGNVRPQFVLEILGRLPG